MAISFPSNPTNGQTYTVGFLTWTYSSSTNSWRGASYTSANLAGGSAGTLPYQSAANTTAMLSAGTTGQVLTSAGASAPTWGAIAQSQITGLTTDLAAKAPLASPTFTGTTTVSGTLKIKPVIETATLVGTGYAGYTVDVVSNAVVYITANAAANGAVNIRGNSGTTLASMLAVGESITTTLLTTNAATAYYVNAVQIDGTVTGVTTKWLGGAAPTSGNINSIDSYTFTIVKTAVTPTYTVFASLSRFA